MASEVDASNVVYFVEYVVGDDINELYATEVEI